MAACSNVDILRSRLRLNLVVSEITAIRVEEVEGDDTSLDILVVHLVLAVHFNHGVAIAMSHSHTLCLPVLDRSQLLVEIASERVHVLVDVVDTQVLQRVKAVVKAGNTQKVDSAVFKATARSTLCVR